MSSTSALTKLSPVSRPWGSAEFLSEVYSGWLAAALAEIESATDYVDASAMAADRVNTSRSRDDPVAGWVRYREGYSPDLAEMLLAQFPPPEGTLVLDPMCGSGSTQLAAQRRGYVGVGFDINPYAVLASRVKTSLLSTAETKVVSDALQQLQEGGLGRNLAIGPADDPVAKYFPSRNYAVLRALRRWVDQWPPGGVRDFLSLALLSIVEDCSDRRKDGNGLLTRPSPVNDPLHHFLGQAAAMLQEAVAQAAFKFPPCATRLVSAIGFDSSPVTSALSLHGNVGAIIFSPPYPNSFDYFESYKLELLFGQLVSEDEFATHRRAAIRSYRQSGESAPSDIRLVEGLIEEILANLPRKEALTGARDARTRLVPNLLRGYFADMREVLRSCAAVLAPGARIHIVVDQSAYAGIPVPTDLILAKTGTELGLVLERLALCRSARTSAQQFRLQPKLRTLLRETIVTLRRPLE
jgi:site-specific DNA-methyltransferase (adenine-specific)